METKMIDQYLAATIIDAAQHRTAKKLQKKDGTVDKSAVTKVKKRFGTFHSYVLDEVLEYGWDCKADEYCLKCLREALDYVAESQRAGKFKSGDNHVA